MAVIIIKEISSNEVIVEHARCNGTGRIGKYLDSPVCNGCNGKGQVLMEVEKLPLVECKRCSGTGRIGKYLDSPVCSSCQGAGCQPIAGRFKVVK